MIYSTVKKRRHRIDEPHTHTHTAAHGLSLLTTRLKSEAEPVHVKVTLPGNHLSLRNSFNYGLCTLPLPPATIHHTGCTRVHTQTHTCAHNHQFPLQRKAERSISRR